MQEVRKQRNEAGRGKRRAGRGKRTYEREVGGGRHGQRSRRGDRPSREGSAGNLSPPEHHTHRQEGVQDCARKQTSTAQGHHAGTPQRSHAWSNRSMPRRRGADAEILLRGARMQGIGQIRPLARATRMRDCHVQGVKRRRTNPFECSQRRRPCCARVTIPIPDMPRMPRLLLLVAAVAQAASGVGAGDAPARGWGGWLARLGSQLHAQPPLRMAGDQALWDAAGGQQVRSGEAREGRGAVAGRSVARRVTWRRPMPSVRARALRECTCLRFASAGGACCSCRDNDRDDDASAGRRGATDPDAWYGRMTTGCGRKGKAKVPTRAHAAHHCGSARLEPGLPWPWFRSRRRLERTVASA
jgi:hypothetical protein